MNSVPRGVQHWHQERSRRKMVHMYGACRLFSGQTFCTPFQCSYRVIHRTQVFSVEQLQRNMASSGMTVDEDEARIFHTKATNSTTHKKSRSQFPPFFSAATPPRSPTPRVYFNLLQATSASFSIASPSPAQLFPPSYCQHQILLLIILNTKRLACACAIRNGYYYCTEPKTSRSRFHP